MATINFFASRNAKHKKEVIDNTVKLTKHVVSQNTAEYYSYINSNGEEMRYNGSLIKQGDNYYGKMINTHKVVLTEHPAVQHVEGVPSYYSYNDNGVEAKFTGVPLYDVNTMTYTGFVERITLEDKIVDIYPLEEIEK